MARPALILLTLVAVVWPALSINASSSHPASFAAGLGENSFFVAHTPFVSTLHGALEGGECTSSDFYDYEHTTLGAFDGGELSSSMNYYEHTSDDSFGVSDGGEFSRTDEYTAAGSFRAFDGGGECSSSDYYYKYHTEGSFCAFDGGWYCGTGCCWISYFGPGWKIFKVLPPCYAVGNHLPGNRRGRIFNATKGYPGEGPPSSTCRNKRRRHLKRMRKLLMKINVPSPGLSISSANRSMEAARVVHRDATVALAQQLSTLTWFGYSPASWSATTRNQIGALEKKAADARVAILHACSRRRCVEQVNLRKQRRVEKELAADKARLRSLHQQRESLKGQIGAAKRPDFSFCEREMGDATREIEKAKDNLKDAVRELDSSWREAKLHRSAHRKYRRDVRRGRLSFSRQLDEMNHHRRVRCRDDVRRKKKAVASAAKRAKCAFMRVHYASAARRQRENRHEATVSATNGRILAFKNISLKFKTLKMKVQKLGLLLCLQGGAPIKLRGNCVFRALERAAEAPQWHQIQRNASRREVQGATRLRVASMVRGIEHSAVLLRDHFGECHNAFLGELQAMVQDGHPVLLPPVFAALASRAKCTIVVNDLLLGGTSYTIGKGRLALYFDLEPGHLTFQKMTNHLYCTPKSEVAFGKEMHHWIPCGMNRTSAASDMHIEVRETLPSL